MKTRGQFSSIVAAIVGVGLVAFCASYSPAGTLGHWQFEGGAAGNPVVTALDSSGNGNVGSPSGTVTYSAETAASGGSASAYFSNTGFNRIVIPDAPALQPASFTLETWLRFDVDQGVMKPVFKSNANEPAGYGFAFQAGDEKPAFFVSSGAGQALFLHSPVALTVGDWHHLAGTYDATSGITKFFVNGTLRGIGTLANPLAHSADPLEIGGHSFSAANNQFIQNGFIDEVRLSDTVLTPPEFLPAYPAAVTVNITTDNAYKLYLSQDDDVAGTLVGEHANWPDTQSYPLDLNRNETYFLHVIGRNTELQDTASWAGVLADAVAPVGKLFAETGTNVAVTDTTNWRAARTTDSTTWVNPAENAFVMRDDEGLGSKNGRDPFGFQPGISADSEWIWTETEGPEGDDGSWPGFIGTDQYVALSTPLTLVDAIPVTIDITADNSFKLYISTDDDVLGTPAGTGNDWSVTEQLHVMAALGRTYYLHVIGANAELDATKTLAGILGDVNVGDGLAFAETGTNVMVTDLVNWRAVETTGPDAWMKPTELAAPMKDGVTHGDLPFGWRPNIEADATWIWTAYDQPVGDHTDRYVAFSAGFTVVPEPGSVALLALGLMGLSAFIIRRRS